MKNIVIIAKIKIKEEFKNEIYGELVKLYEATHKCDEGCIQYELHQDLDNENSFTFIETWLNNECLDLHLEKEHFKTFVMKIENKINGLEISKLEKLNF